MDELEMDAITEVKRKRWQRYSFSRKDAAVAFLDAADAVYTAYMNEFKENPFTLIWVLVANAEPSWLAWPKVRRHYFWLENITYMSSRKLLRNAALLKEWVEIEDFSLENAFLRQFIDDKYRLNIDTFPCKYIPMKKFMVPAWILLPNSQAEIVRCPWFR